MQVNMVAYKEWAAKKWRQGGWEGGKRHSRMVNPNPKPVYPPKFSVSGIVHLGGVIQ